MSDLINLKKQITFYGAYHSNSTNVLIHRICVPFIQWSAQVLFTIFIANPDWFPQIHYKINDRLEFEFNWAFVQAAAYTLYFFILHPTGALLFAPQQLLSVLTATAFAHNSQNAATIAGAVHGLTWIAQFIGHGVYEGRAPALLDNLLGAVVLAPFFVHLENLFDFGWNPQLHKEIQNSIGVEVTRVRRVSAEKKRAAAAAAKKE